MLLTSSMSATFCEDYGFMDHIILKRFRAHITGAFEALDKVGRIDDIHGLLQCPGIKGLRHFASLWTDTRAIYIGNVYKYPRSFFSSSACELQHECPSPRRSLPFFLVFDSFLC
jgi:hypothetical protein